MSSIDSLQTFRSLNELVDGMPPPSSKDVPREFLREIESQRRMGENY